MEQVIAQFRCVGDDGSPLTVVESQHWSVERGGAGSRRRPGARRLALATGQTVRYIDPSTFEVVDTGEILRRT